MSARDQHTARSSDPHEVKVVRPDTNQLRVLSHPMRLRILGLLRTDGPATATRLAGRLGLNSGATSYHLRQLAQHGLITDDAERGNARERWWKAAHDVTDIDVTELDDPADREAVGSFNRTVVLHYQAQLQASLDERAHCRGSGPTPSMTATGISDSLQSRPERPSDASTT